MLSSCDIFLYNRNRSRSSNYACLLFLSLVGDILLEKLIVRLEPVVFVLDSLDAYIYLGEGYMDICVDICVPDVLTGSLVLV